NSSIATNDGQSTKRMSTDTNKQSFADDGWAVRHRHPVVANRIPAEPDATNAAGGARPVRRDCGVVSHASFAHRVSPDRPIELGKFKATADRLMGQRRVRPQRHSVCGVSYADRFTWISRDLYRSKDGAARPGCRAEP